MSVNLKHLTMVLVAWLLAVSPLMAQENQPKPPSLTRPTEGLLFVGSDRNEPYSFITKDGEQAGFDVDVMAAIAAKIGTKITVKLMDPALTQEAVQKGQADGLIGLGIVPGQSDPQDKWILCGPTTTRKYRMLVYWNNTSVKPESDHLALAGTRVAVLTDDPVRDLFENSRNITMDFARLVRDGCVWVQGKRVTAFVADDNVIRYGARKGNIEDVKLAGQPIYEIRQYGPALRAAGDSRNSQALAEQLRQTIKKLGEQGGELAKLQQKWFSHEFPPPLITEQQWFWWVLVACANIVVLALIVAAGRHLFRLAVADRTRKLHSENETLRKQVHDLHARLDKHGSAPAVIVAPAPAGREAAAGLIPTELNQVIRDSVPTLEEAVDGSAKLSIHLPEETPPVVADPRDIQTMLVHLCANARDAIRQRRQSGQEFPERIWIATRLARPEEKPPKPTAEGKRFVALSVRDSGCGIESAMVQKIFQGGFTTKPNAAGQGLAFVYDAVARLGGWIDVESGTNRGAMFTIYLPASE